jgi:hypothetical protein
MWVVTWLNELTTLHGKVCVQWRLVQQLLVVIYLIELGVGKMISFAWKMSMSSKFLQVDKPTSSLVPILTCCTLNGVSTYLTYNTNINQIW